MESQLLNARELEENEITLEQYGHQWEQWGRLTAKRLLKDGTWLLFFENGSIHTNAYDRRFVQVGKDATDVIPTRNDD
ncbi:MAG: hypothetical protein IT322_05135 [Anaerolineae bacterium]|nr:hypothetical protein [Anaerolineae bacterium]